MLKITNTKQYPDIGSANEGKASCVEFNNVPIFYENVALPDGTRSGLLTMADPELGLWRVKKDGKLMYGTVESRKDDFVFVVSDQQVNKLSLSENISYQQLQKCDPIVGQLSNPDFANDFYGALVGNTWTKFNYEHKLDARSAGKIVAKLRDKNECYMDYFGSGTEGEVQNHIELILYSHSFKLSSMRDPNADARRVRELLRICESRTVKEYPPEWFSMWVGELGANVGLQERMLKCCFRGQVTLEEWEEFYILSTTLDV